MEEGRLCGVRWMDGGFTYDAVWVNSVTNAKKRETENNRVDFDAPRAARRKVHHIHPIFVSFLCSFFVLFRARCVSVHRFIFSSARGLCARARPVYVKNKNKKPIKPVSPKQNPLSSPIYVPYTHRQPIRRYVTLHKPRIHPKNKPDTPKREGQRPQPRFPSLLP